VVANWGAELGALQAPGLGGVMVLDTAMAAFLWVEVDLLAHAATVEGQPLSPIKLRSIGEQGLVGRGTSGAVRGGLALGWVAGAYVGTQAMMLTRVSEV
jgi:hypothetical protein